MKSKLTSAEAHEYIKTGEFISYPEQIFDRSAIERLLREAGAVHNFDPPSAKSYLDWARRYGVVEPVKGERGHYRWAPSAEAEAVEIGRKIAQEGQERVTIPDTDPNHPMILPEPEEAAEESESLPYGPGALKVDFYLKAKRVSRRRKRMIKRGIEGNPVFGRITVHCGAEADDMVVTER